MKKFVIVLVVLLVVLLGVYFIGLDTFQSIPPVASDQPMTNPHDSEYFDPDNFPVDSAGYGFGEEKYITIPVVYGTDRKRSGSVVPSEIYGPSREPLFNKGGFYAGIVDVSIPETHERGQIETPSWYNFMDRDDPEKYILVIGIDTIKKSAFERLKMVIALSDSSEAFVFVHGFNNTFADAAKRTAQLAYDVGFQGCPIMYSWPSNGAVMQYVSDYDNVQWAIPHFKAFIEQVVKEAKPKKLHLIAHSMGNHLLTNAVKELQSENRRIRFNQIILAAPDIDASIFENNIAPRLLNSAKRITMYSSSNDRALKASKALRNDYIRAGESGSNIMTIAGVETIDASTLTDEGYFNFDLNHNYFAERVTIIDDMIKLLEHNSPPTRRNLLLIKKPQKGQYWSFKK